MQGYRITTANFSDMAISGIRRNLAALSLAALSASALPAGASADLAPVPAVCETVPALEEDEVLVERTLYFHGTERLGDVQGGGNFASTTFVMDEIKPTSGDAKVKSSKPVVFGNDAYSRNDVNGYWLRELAKGQRIVCAGTTFYAITPNNTIGIDLHVDAVEGTAGGGPDVRASASAPAGNGPRAFTGRFDKVDIVAQLDFSIQFAPAPPGAVLLYDSVEYPSSFTYVTVEQRPEA